MSTEQSYTESLHDLLFSNVSGLPKDDSDAIAYVNQLTTLPLSSLTAEPINLSSAAAVLTSSLSNLCLNECSTFLSLRNTSSTIDTSLAAFDEGVNSLLELIPSLETAAQQFQVEARGIKDERKETLLVVEQQDKLLDILELPQLVDTCVRNGYHQEALDLLNHTRKLAALYPDTQYIREIEKEVDQAIQLMTAQLFNGLRGNVKLPAVFKSINFLRRLKVLDDDELALTFLSFRLEFLEEHLNYILADVEEPSKCLKRYIDAWREGVNDIVMQYESLFLKESSIKRRNGRRELLTALLHRLLVGLFNVLEDKLHRVVEANTISSLMTQLTYCSVSFSKIGMDFRPLLVPLYERTIVSITNEALLTASHEFDSAIDEGMKEDRPPSKLFAVIGGRLAGEHVCETPFTAQTPPSGLTEVPLFARFVNSVIVTLNNLRLLAPGNLREELAGCYDDCLATIVESICKYGRIWLSRAESRLSEELFREELRNLKLVGRVFFDLLIPFIRKALREGVFGGTTERLPLKNNVRSESCDGRLRAAASTWLEVIATGTGSGP
jgi:hypothetical protein